MYSCIKLSCSPLQVASVEKWVDVMYSAVDATGVGQQPLHNANPSMRVLFVAWVIFGTFFISNLIIGVSIDKVGESREEKGHSMVPVLIYLDSLYQLMS